MFVWLQLESLDQARVFVVIGENFTHEPLPHCTPLFFMFTDYTNGLFECLTQ